MTACDLYEVMTTNSGAQEMDLTREAFDALPSQAAILDSEGTILQTNAAWRRFGSENGLASPTSVGESYLGTCDASGEGDGEAVAAGLRALLDGECDEFSFEYPCHEPGGKQRWFLMQALAYGEKPHILVTHTDITERKLAELEVREHNEELSTLASVLSHDVRNPLSAALLRTESLERELDELTSGRVDADATDPHEHVESIASSLERIDAIIEDALLIASGEDLEAFDRVALEEAVTEAWSHVESPDASIRTDELPPIEADASLLTQLLENLFANAIEHGGAAVEVAVTALPDGFAVTDTGPGIDPGDRETVFEQGYTTGDDGTGLGLAIVRKIASAHDWSVDAVDPSAGAADVTGDVGTRIEITGVTIVDEV